FAAHHVLHAGVDERLAFGPGQGYGAHPRRDVADAAVADVVAVDADALHHRSGAGLLLDGVLVVAAAEGVFLEVAVGAGGGVAAVQADGPVDPVAAEACLAPRVDGLRVAAAEGLGEDGVHLGQRQPFDGVVPVDVDGQGVEADTKQGRLVAECVFKGVDLAGGHFPGHGPKLRGAADQRGRSGAGTLALDLKAHVGVELATPLGPEGHYVVHGVG